MEPAKSTPVLSPRLDLDEKGIPKVTSILREIAKSPGGSVPINPHYYSPTPIKTPSSSAGKTTSVPMRGIASSPRRAIPQPVARTPSSSTKQRQIQQIKQATVDTKINPSGVIPRAVVDTTSRSELNRAQRESKRKAEKNTFDDYEPTEDVLPAVILPEKAPRSVSVSTAVRADIPLMPSKSTLSQIQKSMEIVQPGFVSYKTSNGVYTMPDYDNWSPLQREHVAYDFQRKINKLNKDWNKFGLYFDAPKSEEHVTTTHIRHQDYLKVIKRKTGTNLWWILLGTLWIGMEYVGTQVFHLKADGFAALQLKRYKLYEMHMIEMGEGSGFGQDWPPWLQMAITSALGLAVVVGIGTLGKGTEYAGDIMELLNNIITGQEAVEVDEEGNPIPGKESLMDKISQIDFSNMTVAKGLKLYRMFGGGKKESSKPKEDAKSDGAKKKPAKMSAEDREKARKERQRRAEEED